LGWQKTNLPPVYLYYLRQLQRFGALPYLYNQISYMKKTAILMMVFLGFTLVLAAQAYEGTIQFDKKKQSTLIIEYNYPAQAVENAITQFIERLGFKAKEEKGILNRDKGFIVFKNAFVPDIYADRVDYIIKTERKSRKEEDISTLYLVINRNDKSMLQSMSIDDISKAKSFLNNLHPQIEAAYLEIQIKEQEEIVAKAEKKLNDLKAEQSTLEKKLDENKTNQEATQKDIESQKQRLGLLQGKRNKS
jgi:hypothetical protein